MTNTIFFLTSNESCAACLTFLSEQFPVIAQRNGFRATLRAYLHQDLQQFSYHCFHLSDSVERHTAVVTLRNVYAKNLFPVTSVTHSLSYKGFYASSLEHLWQGTSSRDAIVCTSVCAQQVMHAAFDALSSSYGFTGHASTAMQDIALVHSDIHSSITAHGEKKPPLALQQHGNARNFPVFLLEFPSRKFL